MRKACVTLGAVMCVFVSACSERKGITDDEALLGPGVAEQAITLAYSGKMDEAVALLLEGAAPESGAVEPLPFLTMSESEFIRVKEPAFSQMKEANIRASDAARALARAALAKAAEARAQGDEAKAAAYAQRVKALGTLLAGEDRNKLLQLVGRAIEKTAGEAGS